MANNARGISLNRWMHVEAAESPPPPAGLLVEGPCPGCRRQTELRRSRCRGLLENRLLVWFGQRPYRCMDCGRRFRLRSRKVKETWRTSPVETPWTSFLSCNDPKSNGELLLELAAAERALVQGEEKARERGEWGVQELSR